MEGDGSRHGPASGQQSAQSEVTLPRRPSSRSVSLGSAPMSISVLSESPEPAEGPDRAPACEPKMLSPTIAVLPDREDLPADSTLASLDSFLTEVQLRLESSYGVEVVFSKSARSRTMLYPRHAEAESIAYAIEFDQEADKPYLVIRAQRLPMNEDGVYACPLGAPGEDIRHIGEFRGAVWAFSAKLVALAEDSILKSANSVRVRTLLQRSADSIIGPRSTSPWRNFIFANLLLKTGLLDEPGPKTPATAPSVAAPPAPAVIEVTSDSNDGNDDQNVDDNDSSSDSSDEPLIQVRARARALQAHQADLAKARADKAPVQPTAPAPDLFSGPASASVDTPFENLDPATLAALDEFVASLPDWAPDSSPDTGATSSGGFASGSTGLSNPMPMPSSNGHPFPFPSVTAPTSAPSLTMQTGMQMSSSSSTTGSTVEVPPATRRQNVAPPLWTPTYSGPTYGSYSSTTDNSQPAYQMDWTSYNPTPSSSVPANQVMRPIPVQTPGQDVYATLDTITLAFAAAATRLGYNAIVVPGHNPAASTMVNQIQAQNARALHPAGVGSSSTPMTSTGFYPDLSQLMSPMSNQGANTPMTPMSASGFNTAMMSMPSPSVGVWSPMTSPTSATGFGMNQTTFASSQGSAQMMSYPAMPATPSYVMPQSASGNMAQSQNFRTGFQQQPTAFQPTAPQPSYAGAGHAQVPMMANNNGGLGYQSGPAPQQSASFQPSGSNGPATQTFPVFQNNSRLPTGYVSFPSQCPNPGRCSIHPATFRASAGTSATSAQASAQAATTHFPIAPAPMSTIQARRHQPRTPARRQGQPYRRQG